IASALEEAEAREPFLLRERRHVAVEPAADYLEAEQRQPVLQPVERDEVAVPRRRRTPAEVASRAEERERIEPGDDDLAVGAQHAPGLAKHQVRIGSELE